MRPRVRTVIGVGRVEGVPQKRLKTGILLAGLMGLMGLVVAWSWRMEKKGKIHRRHHHRRCGDTRRATMTYNAHPRQGSEGVICYS